MSGSLNEVNLIGNLVRDPETRQSQAGKSIVNITVATSEAWKDRDSGEKKEKSEFHRVVIFSEGLASVASKYLRKGSKVMLRGQLQTRKWTDKDGQEKYSTEVVLQGFDAKLIMLNKIEREDESERPVARGQAKPATDMIDDDIPF